MKIINKEGLLFGKISIIDLLILAMIAGGVFFVISFFDKEEIQVKTETEFYYSYEASNVNEHFIDAITPGTDLYNSSKNHHVGQVVQVTETPYYIWTEDLNKGLVYKTEDPSRTSVVIKVKAKGSVSSTAFYAGQELIKVGHVFPIKGLGFASHGVVIEIEEVQNEGN